MSESNETSREQTVTSHSYPHFERQPDGSYAAFIKATKSVKRNARLLSEACTVIEAWGGGTVWMSAGVWAMPKHPVTWPPRVTLASRHVYG